MITEEQCARECYSRPEPELTDLNLTSSVDLIRAKESQTNSYAIAALGNPINIFFIHFKSLARARVLV